MCDRGRADARPEWRRAAKPLERPRSSHPDYFHHGLSRRENSITGPSLRSGRLYEQALPRSGADRLHRYGAEEATGLALILIPVARRPSHTNPPFEPTYLERTASSPLALLLKLPGRSAVSSQRVARCQMRVPSTATSVNGELVEDVSDPGIWEMMYFRFISPFERK